MREPILRTRSRQQIADDTRSELEAWLDERVAELTAGGMARDDARRRAVEEFGDIHSALRYAQRQDVAAERRLRLMLWLDEMASDIRIAARTLARAPIVAVVVLGTFALGIGTTTAVFSVVHAMLLRALAYGGEDRLVYLPAVDDGVIRPGLGGARHSAYAFDALQRRTTTFAGIAAVSQGTFVLTSDGDPEQMAGAEVATNTFSVLQVRPALGRAFGPGDESGPAGPVVILLDGLWRRRFGADSAIVGRTIELSGTTRTVIGVMPPGFRVPTYELAELLLPYDNSGFLNNPRTAQVRAVRAVGRLKPGVSRDAAQTDVDRAMQSLRAELPRLFSGLETRVVPIRAALVGAARSRLLVLMGAAAFVLLIACANVAGILLSRAIARRHELAVRVALGAGRMRLIRQFLAEGVVLAVLGACVGLATAQLGIVALRRLAETALPAGTTFALEPRVVLFAAVVAIAAALAATLFPAIGATRAVGVALRRDDGRISLSSANRRVRLGLVAAQLAVSVILLIGSGLFLRALHRLSALDLGYDTGHALTFRPMFARQMSDARQDAYYASLYAELRALPGVISVGGGNVPTSGQGTTVGLEIEGRALANARLPDVRYSPASDDYFATLRIPVVRGRVFTTEDRADVPWVGVVSAGLAKQLWPGGDPIGARVKVERNKPWVTIVGVVGDVRMGGAEAPQPSIYTSQRQDHWPGAGPVVLRTQGDPAIVAAGIRQVVRRIDPTLVLPTVRTLDEFRRSTPAIAQRRLLLQLMELFAVVAVIVTAIGVYGMGAYATQARAREFGIRIALGSSRRGVLWLALRDVARVTLFGAVLGVPVAVALASRLGDMLYAVRPLDPMIVGGVLGVLLLVVIVACLVPARRAALADPAAAMRAE